MVFLFYDAFYHVADGSVQFVESYKMYPNTKTSQECSELT